MNKLFSRIGRFFFYLQRFGLRGTLDYVRAWCRRQPLFPIHVKFCNTSLWVRRNLSDFEVLKLATIFRTGFTPPNFTPKVVLDLGANIGVTTAIFAARWPAARVIAIEPEVHNFELLQRNCQPFPNIESILTAIWIRDEELTITNPDATSVEFRVQRNDPSDAANSQKVQGITVPTLMRNLHLGSLDVVKVDIEGAERLLFESDTQLWLPYVRTLIIELHDRFEPGCREAVENAVRRYQPEHLKIDEYDVYQFPE